MAQMLEQVRQDALKLTEKERAGLARDLLTSLGPLDDKAEEAWAEEIDRRLSRIRSGEEPGEAAERVFSELREDLANGTI